MQRCCRANLILLPCPGLVRVYSSAFAFDKSHEDPHSLFPQGAEIPQKRSPPLSTSVTPSRFGITTEHHTI